MPLQPLTMITGIFEKVITIHIISLFGMLHWLPIVPSVKSKILINSQSFTWYRLLSFHLLCPSLPLIDLDKLAFFLFLNTTLKGCFILSPLCQLSSLLEIILPIFLLFHRVFIYFSYKYLDLCYKYLLQFWFVLSSFHSLWIYVYHLAFCLRISLV